MTTLRRSVFLGMALCAAPLLSTLPVSAKTAYDGTWVVTIITTTGGCDPAYRYIVHVADGNVSPEMDSSSASFDISGKVDGGGQVKVSVRRGQQHADGSGRLSEKAGTGAWTGKSASEACAGHWEASRQ
jgi:hypothetical protein